MIETFAADGVRIIGRVEDAINWFSGFSSFSWGYSYAGKHFFARASVVARRINGAANCDSEGKLPSYKRKIFGPSCRLGSSNVGVLSGLGL